MGSPGAENSGLSATTLKKIMIRSFHSFPAVRQSHACNTHLTSGDLSRSKQARSPSFLPLPFRAYVSAVRLRSALQRASERERAEVELSLKARKFPPSPTPLRIWGRGRTRTDGQSKAANKFSPRKNKIDAAPNAFSVSARYDLKDGWKWKLALEVAVPPYGPLVVGAGAPARSTGGRGMRQKEMQFILSSFLSLQEQRRHRIHPWTDPQTDSTTVTSFTLALRSPPEVRSRCLPNV